jgi:MFS family permease
LGASYFEVGMLFAALEIAWALAVLPLGLMADRFGKKHFACLGFALLSFTPVAYALSWHPWQLIGFRCLQGVSEALNFTIGTAYVARMAQKKGQAIGAYQSLANLGFALAPLPASLLIDNLGIKKVFFIGAAVMSLGFLASLPVEKDEPVRGSKKPVRFIKNRFVYLVSVLAAFPALTMGFSFAFLQVFFYELVPSERVVGFTITIYFVSYSLAMLLAGHLVDSLGWRQTSLLGLTGSGMGFIALFLAPNMLWAELSVWFLGLAQALASVPFTAKLADLSAGETAGSLSVLTVFRMAALAGGASLGGMLSQLTGLRLAFLLCGGIMFLGGVLLVLMKKYTG